MAGPATVPPFARLAPGALGWDSTPASEDATLDADASARIVETVEALDDDALTQLFTLVYTDYHVPMHVDGPAMRFMRVASDLDRSASRLVRDGGEAVAIAMMGVRGDDGWIGGMGVSPSHRGRGLGAHVMRAVLESARARGLRRVMLEVLQQNTHAIRLYEHLGFRHVRDLEVWAFPAPDAPDEAPSVEPVPVEVAHRFIRDHRLAPEPWQRADGTLAALLADGVAFEGLLAKRGEREVGAMVARVAGRASVVQLATLPGEASSATRALLSSLRRDDAPQGVRWLNLPATDAAAEVLRALGLACDLRQHEMELVLR